MSELLLSCLLILLLFIVARPLSEHFVPNPVVASPALANLIATPLYKPEPVRVNTLARAQEVKCPVCPDMSQYVRLDEVPCWNCSLP